MHLCAFVSGGTIKRVRIDKLHEIVILTRARSRDRNPCASLFFLDIKIVVGHQEGVNRYNCIGCPEEFAIILPSFRECRHSCEVNLERVAI